MILSSELSTITLFSKLLNFRKHFQNLHLKKNRKNVLEFVSIFENSESEKNIIIR